MKHQHVTPDDQQSVNHETITTNNDNTTTTTEIDNDNNNNNNNINNNNNTQQQQQQTPLIAATQQQELATIQPMQPTLHQDNQQQQLHQQLHQQYHPIPMQAEIFKRHRGIIMKHRKLIQQIQRNNQLVLDSIEQQLQLLCQSMGIPKDESDNLEDVDDETDEEEVDLYSLEQQHHNLSDNNTNHNNINNINNINGDSTNFNPALDAASSWSKFIASFQNINQHQQQHHHSNLSDSRVNRNEQQSPLAPLQINNNDCGDDDNDDDIDPDADVDVDADADTDLLEAECLENEPDVDQDPEADIEQAEADFICAECNKSFNSLRKLRHHKVVHSNEFPFECDASGCFKRFKRKFGLDLHMATHFDFSPDMYTKTPNNSSLIYFDIHRKQNQQQQGLYCKKCNSAFKTILEYQNHMLKHSDRPFKCPMSDCNQSFSSWKSFQKHRASHCFNYHCQVDPSCRHKSTNLQLLKLHIFSCHYKGKLQPEISRSLENDAQPPTGASSGQINNNNQDYYSDVASMDAVTICSDVNDMPEDMSCQPTGERNHKSSHDSLHEQSSNPDVTNNINNDPTDVMNNHDLGSLTTDNVTVSNIEASMAHLNQYQSPLIASYLMEQDLIRNLTERTKQRYNEELTRANKRDRHQKMIIKSLLSETIRKKRPAVEANNMTASQYLTSAYDLHNQSGNASIDLRTSQNKLKKHKLESDLDLGYPMALDMNSAVANHALSSSPSTPIPYHSNNNNNNNINSINNNNNNNNVSAIMAKTSRGQISNLSSSNDVDFKCDTCGSSFDDRHRLMQHQSIHLDLNKDWYQEDAVDKVMKIFNRRRGEFLCNQCNLRFEATFDYDKHNHSVHGQRPYCCEFCGNGTRTFRFWRQYLNHLYDHRYIFSCKIDNCDFSVNRRDSLRFHIFRFHLNCQLPQRNLVSNNSAQQIQQSQTATS